MGYSRKGHRCASNRYRRVSLSNGVSIDQSKLDCPCSCCSHLSINMEVNSRVIIGWNRDPPSTEIYKGSRSGDASVLIEGLRDTS